MIRKIITQVLFYALFFCLGGAAYNAVHLNHDMVEKWMITTVVIAFLIFVFHKPEKR